MTTVADRVQAGVEWLDATHPVCKALTKEWKRRIKEIILS